MPRAYGLLEIQRIVDEAWRAGRSGDDSPPDATALLRKLNIWHGRNRLGTDGTRSWFAGARGMNLAGSGGCTICLVPPGWPHEEGCPTTAAGA